MYSNIDFAHFFKNVKIPLNVLPVEAELYVFSFDDGGDGVNDGDVTHELLHKDSVSPPHRLRVCYDAEYLVIFFSRSLKTRKKYT